MLPSTPGGVGVYEAGVVGLFQLLGWNPAEGAAYGLLLRLDDVVFIVAAIGAVAGGGTKALAEPAAAAAPEKELQRTGAGS
jgi:uncharacterized membrane protein YbhN (UPF0104 family)